MQSEEVSFIRLSRSELIELVRNRFNPYEQKMLKNIPDKMLINFGVVILRSKGLSYQQIANKIGLSKDQVYYALKGSNNPSRTKSNNIKEKSNA